MADKLGRVRLTHAEAFKVFETLKSIADVDGHIGQSLGDVATLIRKKHGLKVTNPMVKYYAEEIDLTVGERPALTDDERIQQLSDKLAEAKKWELNHNRRIKWLEQTINGLAEHVGYKFRGNQK